jgi:hypothetical protein
MKIVGVPNSCPKLSNVPTAVPIPFAPVVGADDGPVGVVPKAP